MATTTQAPARRGSARVHVQRFGSFLSSMVLPNIGAFIAWGLITALFIETGWITTIGDALGYSGGYGFVDPLTLRTYCSAAAATSSSVAGGAKPCSGRMFLHMRRG